MFGFFNVRDHGATGDGVTNDAPAINSVNDLAVAAGGGYIYLPPGVYLIKSAILLGTSSLGAVAPVTLGGDGGALSIIKAGALTNQGGDMAGAIMVANAQFNATGAAIVQTNIYVEKLGFDCNAADNYKKGNGPIYLKLVQNCGVSDCVIYDSGTHGIRILGLVEAAQWPTSALINFRLVRNRIDLNYMNATQAGVFPIRVSGASLGLIRSNTIGYRNDPGLGHTNDGIDFPGSSDVLCCKNYITQCADGTGSNAAADAIFAFNRIVAPGAVAISTFSTAGDEGAGENGVNDVVMLGNTILQSARKGIRVSSPSASGPDEPVSTVSKKFAVAGNVVGTVMASAGPAVHIEADQGAVTANTIDLGGAAEHGIGIDPSKVTEGGEHGANYLTCAQNVVASGNSGAVGLNFVGGTGETFQDTYAADNNIDSTIGTPLGLPSTISSLSSCGIRDNIRANPYIGSFPTPPVPATPGVSVANALPFDVDVYVTGGVFTQIKVNGYGTGLTNGTFFVPAGGRIEWDYTGVPPPTAPTWKWIPR